MTKAARVAPAALTHLFQLARRYAIDRAVLSKEKAFANNALQAAFLTLC
jgi:hypothetical protein